MFLYALLSLAIASGPTPAQSTPSPTRYVTSADGTRIAFDVTGSGPALMLLHGGGQNRRIWHEAGYVERLARDFTVITVDIRGNGDSDKPQPASAFAIDKLLADFIAVADAAGAKRFHLWGFSYGANVGRYLAARTTRVASMAYIGIGFGPAADATFRKAILERQIGWLTAILDYPPVEPADMKCPTLWIVGTANAGAMASVKEYQSRLAGTPVQLELLEGLNHPQELGRIETTLPKAVAFTKRHPIAATASGAR